LTSLVSSIFIFWSEPVLAQSLSRQTIDISDHLLEILRVRIVSQYELGLLLQVSWHISSRPHLSKDLTPKPQGTGSFVWHRHVGLP
jgi:hypothetical protein